MANYDGRIKSVLSHLPGINLDIWFTVADPNGEYDCMLRVPSSETHNPGDLIVASFANVTQAAASDAAATAETQPTAAADVASFVQG